MASENQNSIAWEADEFPYYHKSLGWYIVVVAITILAIAFFIVVLSDLFAAVCLALIAALAIFFARQFPRRVSIELSDKGIHFDRLFYPYKQIKYFWVVHTEHHQSINILTTALVNNMLILELEDQNPEEVRKFLLRHISEHSETQATATQKIMHRLKF